jgi:hypothetical protein
VAFETNCRSNSGSIRLGITTHSEVYGSSGTSRQFIAAHQFGRYQSEADMPESVGGASIDENDPLRT